MKKILKWQESLLVIGAILSLTIVSALFLFNNAKSSYVNSSKTISNQIVNLIEKNEDEKNVLQESLKEEYISRAKSLAFILDKDASIMSNYDELCKTAEILDIDEIDIFDTNGIIIYSTVEKYVGYDMHNPGQISFFLPLLEPGNYDLTLCQDLTSNSFEGKETMYAMVWGISHEYLVEIGITPERLLASMSEKDISKVLKQMPLTEELYLIYDTNLNKIVSSTNESLYGLSNEDFGVDFNDSKKELQTFTLDKTEYLASSTYYKNYIISVCIERRSLYRSAMETSIGILALLTVVIVGFYVLLKLLTFKENKKEQIYLADLEKATNTLYNYKHANLSEALISLEVNLTKNILQEGIWKDDEGNEVSLKSILNLDLPCSYDEYISKWKEKFVLRDFSNSFGKETDREFLIDAFNKGSSDVTFDYEAKTIEGNRKWLRRSISMVKDSNGDIISYTNVKDISEIISADKREEAYIRALAVEFESIIVVMFNDDKYKDEVIMNSKISDELYEIVGEEYDKEKFFSKKLDILMKHIVPEDVDEFYRQSTKEIIMESLLNDKIHTINFRLKDKNDNQIYYQARFISLIENDKIVGIISNLRNIDDEIKKEMGIRKELEDAKIASEASSRAKSTFLFNMSHDIRTPMNAIIGFTNIADAHIDDKARVKDSLSKVKSASEHLLSLINDILDMSRIESGKTTVSEEPISIDASINNLKNILSGSASEKGIKLNTIIDPNIKHHWIYGDRLLIMRVLTNIISNSIKYTNEGGNVEVLLKELPCEKENYCHYQYMVTDNGIGMSKEFLEHIFEQFSRAESATKSGVVGTGLGMAITKSLVDLMGGTINIESEPGVGTKVTLDFEHRIAEESDSNETIEDKVDLFGALKGKKVLLVEDNELNREIAIEILKEKELVVDIAEDGDVAVEKMKSATKDTYDLILMDIQMPRMNGYDATIAIRNLDNPYGKEIPIIAMTANAFEEDIKKSLSVGMNGHLMKPINVQNLFETIYDLTKKAN